MIKLRNVEVTGFEQAIRGMRNPKNSWEKSDSGYCSDIGCKLCSHYTPPLFCDLDEACNNRYLIGPNDHKLMMNLAAGGSTHAKYRRMIVVYVDITAPLYWWKEFDTYKVGTVANSCSTMHKIAAKEFTWDDFSCEHLMCGYESLDGASIRFDHYGYSIIDILGITIDGLNHCREKYLETKDKEW